MKVLMIIGVGINSRWRLPLCCCHMATNWTTALEASISGSRTCSKITCPGSTTRLKRWKSGLPCKFGVITLALYQRFMTGGYLFCQLASKFQNTFQEFIWLLTYCTTWSSLQWWSGRLTTSHDVLNLWSPIWDPSVWGMWGANSAVKAFSDHVHVATARLIWGRGMLSTLTPKISKLL